MQSAGRVATAAILAGLAAAGCNFERFPATFFEQGGPWKVAADAVVTRDVVWRGWPAIEQTNGLITVRHVPAAGGRTLSLQIGGDDAFYCVSAEQAGRSHATDGAEKIVDFGGDCARVGPEPAWRLDEQPFNTFCGPYDATQRTDSPEAHELRLASRPGRSKGATITVERVLTLARGHTHVVIEQTITNRGARWLDLSLCDCTQIDASSRRPTPSGSRTPASRPALRRLTAYVPTPPSGGGRKRYRSLLPMEPAARAGFEEGLPGDVLGIHWNGTAFKVASRPALWWAAAVDSDSGWTYVKAFDARPDVRYAEGAGPVVASGRSGGRGGGPVVIDLELHTGVARLAPGAAIHQREHWYATVCRGPVLALAPVGVVCRQLRVQRDMDYYDVSGRFGVFYLGSGRLAVLGERDEVLFAGEPMVVDPRRELNVSATLQARAGARAIVLLIYDHEGRLVGELSRTALP